MENRCIKEESFISLKENINDLKDDIKEIKKDVKDINTNLQTLYQQREEQKGFVRATMIGLSSFFTFVGFILSLIFGGKN